MEVSEKKKFVLTGVLVAAVLICACPVVFAAEVRVGLIDTQELLKQHPKYPQTLTQIVEMAERKQSEAGADEESFNRMREEVAEEEWRLMQPLFDEIDAAIRAVVVSMELTHVLDKDRLYFGSGMDITEAVVGELIRMNDG